MAHRVRTATAPLTVRPQMATSMRQRTGTPTRTPGVAGRAQARTLRNTTHQATLPRRVVQLRAAGEGRKRAADHRPSTAAAVAGNERGKCSRRRKQGRWRRLGRSQMSRISGIHRIAKVWRTGMSQAAPGNSFTTWLMLLALMVCLLVAIRPRRSPPKQHLLRPTTQATVC